MPTETDGGGSDSRRWLRRKFTVVEKRWSKMSAVVAVELQVRRLGAGDDHGFSSTLMWQKRTRVDYGALGPELSRKVSARIAAAVRKDPALTPKSAPWIVHGRLDPSRITPDWIPWALGGWCASGPLLGACLLTPTVYLPVAALTALVMPWAATAGAALAIRNWQSSSPLTLSRAEVKVVREHTSVVKFDVPWESRSQEPYAIQVVAAKILSEIESSSAWQSTHCDLDRIQLDLAEEMFQIQQSCANLVTLHNLIVDAKPLARRWGSSTQTALKNKVSEYENVYTEAREAVIGRVAALRTYRQRLTQVEVLLEDLAKTTELVGRTDEFTEAFSAIARDTAAAQRTEAMSADLELLQSRLQAELAFISGTVINDPDLVMPLAISPVWRQSREF
ncbi:Uncharacterised protein [Mycobacteroides abscessus subsp. abscessus]|nr:Uncharacterised protein [Mycobacteroides abscessus subsp. abscessus]SIC79372.1 Uncharacterised protein [Mycobacteroides abscessus subsp. abscessus]SKK32989.1 Uncharacterised protein [Mycobacteroides abscessus subsp. abscessus]SKP26670.1 Uncharacterised protein [Mycobacteroides abscessus subsp. abscessus]